jgi:uncharacterized protein (TIRG00374 family)
MTTSWRFSRLLLVFLFLSGMTLFGVMVWQVGFTGLLASFQAMGLWIVPYVLLDTVPTLLHTLGLAACFQRRQCSLRLWQLALVRLAGGAINQLTPTATLGGEVVKVQLLESALPREQALAAVVIDKTSYALARMIYLALGILYLTRRLPLPVGVQWSVSLTIGLITLGVVIFIACQRYGALSKFIRGLGHLNIAQVKLHRLSQHLVHLDTQLVMYYMAHPWRFTGSVLAHCLGHTSEVFQTYILLHFLLGGDAPGFADAVAVAIAVAALDEAFFFMPGRLGTLEGARFTVLSALGVAKVYGLAFGLVVRIQNLVWSGIGLLAYVMCTRLPGLRRPAQPVSSLPFS